MLFLDCYEIYPFFNPIGPLSKNVVIYWQRHLVYNIRRGGNRMYCK